MAPSPGACTPSSLVTRIRTRQYDTAGPATGPTAQPCAAGTELAPKEHMPTHPTGHAHAPPGSSGSSATAASSSWSAEVGATLRQYTVGDRRGAGRLRPGRVVARRPRPGAGPVAQPAGRRPLRVRRAPGPRRRSTSPSAATPSTAWCGGCRGGSRRRRRTCCRPACHAAIPTPGYPFSLDLRVEYRLGRDGLAVTTTAANAAGPDPPVRPGVPPLPHRRRRPRGHGAAAPAGRAAGSCSTPGRCRPARSQPVAGTEYDFTDGPGDRADRGWTPPSPASYARRRRARLGVPGRPDRRPVGVDLWVDDRFAYLMCYTGDTLDDPARRRRAVAVEPMTCPPTPSARGRDLVVLEPGQEWEGTWGLQPG